MSPGAGLILGQSPGASGTMTLGTGAALNFDGSQYNGALIVGVFRNGLALGGADALWQEFAVGVLIILAVAIDQWIRKVGA